MQTTLWAITSIAVPTLVVLGVMLMQTTSPTRIELTMARCCFVPSAALLAVAIAISVFTRRWNMWMQVPSAVIPAAVILGAFYFLDKWAQQRVERQRGDLLFTSLNFDYNRDTEQISARVMFFNDDSITRFVISVGFTYRSNSAAQGFEVFSTGSETDLLLGHVDPVRIAPNTPEIKEYSGKVAKDKLSIIGAQAGLLINFSLPGRGYASATVTLLEVKRSGLSLPALELPRIADLSLDSISDASRIASIIADYRAAIEPRGFLAKFRRLIALDY